MTFMLLGEKFKPVQNPPPWFEFGYHTWSHKVLPDCSVSDLFKETKNMYGCKSFTAPMWKIGSLLDEELFVERMLKDGYRIMTYRGTSASELHSGPAFLMNGMKLVYVSATTRGTMEDMKTVILSALDTARLDMQFGHESIFVIATHDFVYKDTKALEFLWNNLSQFQWLKMEEL